MTTTKPTIAVAIATTGRPAVLTETLREVKRQTLAPDIIAICPAEDHDVDHAALATLELPIMTCRGDRGASAQRNAILRALPPVDAVLFLDDDFFLAPDYLEEMAALFVENPEIMLATGVLIADGATGPGFEMAEARALIAGTARKPVRIEDVFSGYGLQSSGPLVRRAGSAVRREPAALQLGRRRGIFAPGRAVRSHRQKHRLDGRASRDETGPDIGGCGSAIHRSPTRSISGARA